MNNFRFQTVIAILITFSSCQNNEPISKSKPNEKIFGVWQYNDSPNSYIEIRSDKYEERLGELNSSITGNIYWQDTLHYILVVNESKGVIKKTVRTHNKFNIEILELTDVKLRFRATNLEIQPIIELTKVNLDIGR